MIGTLLLASNESTAGVRVIQGGGPSLVVGDSKSIHPRFQLDLERYARPIHPMWLDSIAVGGSTAAIMQARIDSDIATNPRVFYENILINFGANDVLSLPAQATWEADLGYILDALHARWPNARVFVMKGSWNRGKTTECATLKTWIGNVLATRAWAFAGPDETVFIENGDDGITYNPDGVHPNAAGYALTGLKWAQSLGYTQ